MSQMEEILKFVAAGGSVTTGILIYYIWKIDPRIRSLEFTILQGQKIDLLKLTKELSHLPDAHEKAKNMLQDVETQLKL